MQVCACHIGANIATVLWQINTSKIDTSSIYMLVNVHYSVHVYCSVTVLRYCHVGVEVLLHTTSRLPRRSELMWCLSSRPDQSDTVMGSARS